MIWQSIFLIAVAVGLLWVVWHFSRKQELTLPSCFGSNPSFRAMGKNQCHSCPFANSCLPRESAS